MVAARAAGLLLAGAVASAAVLLRKDHHVHFNLGQAEKVLGKDVLAKLEQDAAKDKRCTHNATAKAPGQQQQQLDASATARCLELCKGNQACVGVCGEVQLMLCTGEPQQILVAGSSSAVAEAAKITKLAAKEAAHTAAKAAATAAAAESNSG